MGPTSEKYTMDGKKQNNGKHICKYCKAGFSTKSNLIYHLSVCPIGSDKRTKKYACEWCKQEFSSEFLLQYHRTSCHCKVKNKFYEGFKFKFPFASIDSMHEENLVDVDDFEVRYNPNNIPPQDLPILCKWCGRDFMSEEQYKKHHPGCPNKPCPEQESEDEELFDPADMMQEEDSEVFRCLWCFGRFGTAAQLKLHRNICPKRRFRDSSFKNKALTDDKSSTDQENVKEPPVKTSESPKRIFTCEWCGKVWTNEVPFLVHPIMCPKKPKVKEASNEAKKEHPIPRPKTPPGMFKCEWCGRIFEDWHRLQWHRNDCPDNPDKKKGLQDGNHDPIPKPKTPPNTYRCEWCERVFSSEYHLNWHRQRCPKRPKPPPKEVTEKKISPGTEHSKSKKKNSHKKRKRVDILERRPDIRWLWDLDSFEEESFSRLEDEEGFENRTDFQSQSESDGKATQINMEETRSDNEAYTPATPSDSLNGKLVGLRPNSSTKTNCSASPIVKRFKCRISGVMLEDQVQFGFTILEAHFDFRHRSQVDFENPDSSAATDTKIVELELDYEENGSEGSCAKSDENHPSVLVTNGQFVLNHSNGDETYQCEWCRHYFSNKDHFEWHKERCPKKPKESGNEDMTKQRVTPKNYDGGQLGTPCRKRKSAGSDVASAKKLRFVDFDEKSAPSCDESMEDYLEIPEDVLNRSHVEAKANDSPSNQKSGIEPKDPPKEVETPCTEFLVIKCKACNKHFEAPKPKLRFKDFIIRHNKEKHGIQDSFDGFLIKISSILNPIIRDKEIKGDDEIQGTADPADEELGVEFDYEKIGNHEGYRCKKCDKKYKSVLKMTRHHRLIHGSPQGLESDKSKSVLQKFQEFDENVRKHPQTRKGGGGRRKRNPNPKSPKKQKEESIKPQTFSCIPCNSMFYTQHEKDVHLRTAEHRKTLEKLAEQGKK